MTDPKAAPVPLAARAEQVRATRQRVLAAARDLFLRRGYAGTTIEAIAHRATVSPQTVYNVIGGKAGVLKAVYDVALAGDDEPVPIQQRPIFQQIAEAPDAHTCLRLYARVGASFLERAGPLLTVVFVAGADPELRAFVDKIENERATGTRGMARHVSSRFGLRPGLTEEEAADVLWALTAPELADRLIRRRGWTPERFEQWLAQTMTDALQ